MPSGAVDSRLTLNLDRGTYNRVVRCREMLRRLGRDSTYRAVVELIVCQAEQRLRRELARLDRERSEWAASHAGVLRSAQQREPRPVFDDEDTDRTDPMPEPE